MNIIHRTAFGILLSTVALSHAEAASRRFCQQALSNCVVACVRKFDPGGTPNPKAEKNCLNACVRRYDNCVPKLTTSPR